MEKSFWQKILIGFNPYFYKEIILQPLKRSFKFLAFFLLFLALFFTFRYSYDFYQFLSKITETFPIFIEKLKDFPEIRVEKGKLISPKEKFIQEFADSHFFIIDPQGEISDYLEGEAFILLKDRVIFRGVETEIFPLSEIGDFNLKFNQQKTLALEFNGRTFELTAEKIKFWRNRLIPIIFPFLFIFTFISFFIEKTIRILFFSLISLIVNKIKKLNLSYSNLLNIGIFALIPPLIFETIIKLPGLKIPYFGIIYSILYLAFLIIGLLKSKR